MIKPLLFSIHRIFKVLGNFCLIFDLENGGSTYTRVNTVMLEENEKEEVAEEEKETKKKNPKAEKESAEKMRLKSHGETV